MHATYKSAADVERPLIDRLSELDGGRSSFAASLVDQWHARRSLSPKQWDWVHKLIAEREARAKEAAVPTDLARLHAYFEGTGLKQPKIFILTPRGTIACKVAGAQARQPGVINLLLDNQWLGRVNLDGTLFLSRSAGKLIAKADLLAAIDGFLADPEAAAKAYGQATSACCFCGEGLTDERSVLAGYGPICAGRYSLPWGDRPEDETKKG